MLLSTLASAALLLPAAAGPLPARPAGDHGALPWYEGNYEDLMAAAQESGKLVFLDFWTEWCVWCKRLDKDTFSEAEVVTAMEDILCFSIDAESAEGAPIARRFGVTGYPALLILEPDGVVRDKIGGYLKPEVFVSEIERVQRDEDTITSMRRAIEAAPDDLDQRYRFAQKLQSVGDRDGHAEQVAAIRERDPDGTSKASRHLRYDELHGEIYTSLRKGVRSDIAPMLAFLAEEQDSELVFRGWLLVATVYDVDARSAVKAEQPEAALEAGRKNRDAYRKAWPACPEKDVAGIGNQIAWTFWLARADLTDEDKAFALSVARKAAEAAGDEVSVIDTLACVLYMNGEVEEAQSLIQRCIELDPENEQWPARLEEFTPEG